MPIYQSNDRTNPAWVLDQIKSRPEDISWVGACFVRCTTFLDLYIKQQIDRATLKFNLVNIRGTKHEYASYQESIHKNQLDDLINPLIESL